MKLQKRPQMGIHFAQKYGYAGTGENAWFADLDPECQLRDTTNSSDANDGQGPSYRGLLSRTFVRPVVNKVRILQYRLKHLKNRLSNSSEPAKPSRTIEWAELDLERQEKEAQERHGAHGYTVYQITQARIRVQKLRKRYLQKKRKRESSTIEQTSH